MSTPPNRRSGSRQPESTTERRRREPLFPLEDDDIAPRRLPSRPLNTPADAVPPARVARPPHVDRPAPPPPRRSDALPREAPPRPTRPLPAQPAGGRPPASDTYAQRRPSAADSLGQATTQLHRARVRYEESESDLHHLDLMLAQPYEQYRPRSTPELLPFWSLPLIAGVSILILVLFFGRDATNPSNWSLPIFEQEAAAPLLQLAGPANPVGDHRLLGAPSLTPDQIDRILADFGSPATGTGAIWYNLGLERGIDPAFAVAFFIHESSAGTAQNWAGMKPDGSTTHNVGNIICAGYATCYNRFRDYPSWEVGIADWYRLIDVEYIQGRGTLTVAEIIPIYAPAFENDVQGYVNVVTNMVDRWRSGEVP